MLDPEDELFDRKLANHLVSLYYKSSEQEEQEMLVSQPCLQHSNHMPVCSSYYYYYLLSSMLMAVTGIIHSAAFVSFYTRYLKKRCSLHHET